MRLVLDCTFALIAHVIRQSARDMALAPGDQVVASFKATVLHPLPRIRHSPAELEAQRSRPGQ
jgi:hypothetical protein